MNQCDVIEEILTALYDWNFTTFSIADLYKTLGVIESEITSKDMILVHETVWDLVVERVVTPGNIDHVKGQLFFITSKDKLTKRLAVCKLADKQE